MIKLLALLSMTIDHFNDIILNGHYLFLTFIGRFAFPIFIFLSLKSYLFYTHSKENYIKRIFYFSVLSIPLYYVGFHKFIPFNILFTISFNLLFIYFFENKKYFYLPFVFLAICFSDYSYISLSLYLSLYLLLNSYDKIDYLLYSFLFLLSLIFLNPLFYFMSAFLVFFIVQLEIIFDNNSKLSINKYFFYFYYPLHIAFFGIMGLLI